MSRTQGSLVDAADIPEPVGRHVIAVSAPSRPRRSRLLVQRPRLYALIDRGVAGPLTLVSAPAGSGKTLLLVDWLAQQEQRGPVAWLSLEGRGGDTAAFWRDLLAAIAAATGISPLPEARTEAEAAAAIAVGLAGDGPPLVVVLDDFHELRSHAAVSGFAHLLAHAPERLRVVVSTRRDPDLRLHRLRLEGALTEIRARELAFTEEEAVELFAGAGLAPEPEHVRILVARSEGWAAGLRFAAISMRAHDDVDSFVVRFEQTERAVSDYLLREVLSIQPAELRDFLLVTSICDRLCAELADALTGRSDGARTLAELERDNVFIELDADGWYRYHRLFAALLRAEASYTLGAGLDEAHAKAARWLARRGHALEALRHAAAAGDAALAAELVRTLWVDVVGRGEVEAVSALLDRVPPEEARHNEQLALLSAWARLRNGDHGDAESWLARADELAAELGGERRADYDLARGVVRVEFARLDGDLGELERALDALERPPVPALSSQEAERRRAHLLSLRGALQAWRGEAELATATLEEAIEGSRRLGLRDAETNATAMLALVRSLCGDLRRAARLGHAATALPRGGGHAPVAALAALSICASEWDNGDEARSYARAARDAAHAAGDRLGRVVAAVVSAAGIGRGGEDGDGATVGFAALRRDLAACATPPLLAPAVGALHVRFAVADGDGTAAEAALAEFPSGAELLVARGRVELAGDHAEHAEEILAPVAELRVRSTYGRTPIEAAVLCSLAAERLRRPEQARRWIEEALELAEPEGVRGPFLDAGPAVVEPLRLTVRHGTAHRWLAAALLSVFSGRNPERGSVPSELLDPLSDKERVVLRYLPTLMSNQEIAGELFVSVNTVKTHLKSIYRKLGVSQRREAVRRARELRLIA